MNTSLNVYYYKSYCLNEYIITSAKNILIKNLHLNNLIFFSVSKTNPELRKLQNMDKPPWYNTKEYCF